MRKKVLRETRTDIPNNYILDVQEHLDSIYQQHLFKEYAIYRKCLVDLGFKIIILSDGSHRLKNNRKYWEGDN